MKHTLLLALFLGSLSATAQGIVAGQTTGVLYTDIVPDRVASVSFPINSSVNSPITAVDSLDLNLDGRYDIKWTAYLNYWSQSGRSGIDNQFSIRPLHTDIEIATSVNSYAASCFGPQSIIANILPQTSGANNTWATPAILWPAYRLIDFGMNPASPFPFSRSSWIMGQDRYMGIRIRGSGSAPWVYGWVNIQVNSPLANNPTVFEMGFTATIKEYALGTTTLGNKTATEVAWHAYPNPMERTLMLRGVPVGSQVRIVDTQGRVRIAGQGNAVGSLEIDVQPLPAGVYVLQMTSTQGQVSTRRLIKL